MKKIAIITATLSILSILGLPSCSNTCKSQSADGNSELTQENAGQTVIQEEPKCGAYTQQRDLTPEELDLFRNTMKDDAYTPYSVATQVVAGINYRFCCKGPDGDVVVTIFKPLNDAPRVTEISK